MLVNEEYTEKSGSVKWQFQTTAFIWFSIFILSIDFSAFFPIMLQTFQKGLSV